MARQPAVYILSSAPHCTLYIGVTSNLCARIWQHRHDLVPGFSRSYRTHSLVWFEVHDSMYSAITREKQLKEWRRSWKIRLIRATNPQWRDLWSEICS